MYFTSSDGLKRWRAFLDLCALLAPRAIASEPLHDSDWKVIVCLASDHKVSPAVWRSIKGQGFVANEAKAHFYVAHQVNAKRNALILSALAEAVSSLQEIGINPVLLKGAANLVGGLYTDPAERILTDIDLLVSSGQVEAAKAALCGIGYAVYSPNSPSPRWVRYRPQPPDHHIAPLVHPSGIFRIEIHRSLVTTEFECLVRTSDMFERAVAIQWNGHSVFALHPTDRIVHNIVHAQLQDARFSSRTIELRQMRELALLAARHGRTVDWSDVEHRFSSTGHANVLAEQAALCRGLMGIPLPVAATDARQSMNRLCHGVSEPLLRRGAGAVLTALAREYAARFMAHPLLGLNLLNPFWWPQRVRGIWRKLERRDALDHRPGSTQRGPHRDEVSAAISVKDPWLGKQNRNS